MYEIISQAILAHPIISIYLMGCVVAFGIAYSLRSANWASGTTDRYFFIVVIIASWVTVFACMYGFMKGFFEGVFGKNDEDEGGN